MHTNDLTMRTCVVARGLGLFGAVLCLVGAAWSGGAAVSAWGTSSTSHSAQGLSAEALTVAAQMVLTIALAWGALLFLRAAATVTSPQRGNAASRRLAGVLLACAATLIPAGAHAAPVSDGAVTASAHHEGHPGRGSSAASAAATAVPGASTTNAVTAPQSSAPTPDLTVKGGWTPQRTEKQRSETRLPLLSRCDRAPAATSGNVTVRQGDTLWGIVTAHLGGSPSPATVLREVQRWYDHNASVIGDSPDRILPGQILTPPDDATTSSGPAAGDTTSAPSPDITPCP